jgi:hypothetical protein
MIQFKQKFANEIAKIKEIKKQQEKIKKNEEKRLS